MYLLQLASSFIRRFPAMRHTASVPSVKIFSRDLWLVILSAFTRQFMPKISYAVVVKFCQYQRLLCLPVVQAAC